MVGGACVCLQLVWVMMAPQVVRGCHAVVGVNPQAALGSSIIWWQVPVWQSMMHPNKAINIGRRHLRHLRAGHN